MFEYILLGITQGIAEWLPISSEGMIVLIETKFFGGGSLPSLIELALFLHLGTLLAALVYFRRDIAHLLKAATTYNRATVEMRATLVFLFLSTAVGGGLGFILLKIIESTEKDIGFSGKVVTLLVGIMLIVTGALQLIKRGNEGKKTAPSLSVKDGIVLGILQGFAVLPGISRSGITVSGLMLRGFSDTEALRLSFLMSMPIVFAGNIILNMSMITSLSGEKITGLIAAFIFGLLTIKGLIAAAERIPFGKFIIGFGILMIISTFV